LLLRWEPADPELSDPVGRGAAPKRSERQWQGPRAQGRAANKKGRLAGGPV